MYGLSYTGFIAETSLCARAVVLEFMERALCCESSAGVRTIGALSIELLQ